MKLKVIVAALATLCLISCGSEQTDNQTVAIDERIPEITNQITYIPRTHFDTTAKGKYVGVLGHYQDSDVRGKIYVNVGMDTRYTAVVDLVNGE